MVPHSWTLESLRIVGVDEDAINLLENSMRLGDEPIFWRNCISPIDANLLASSIGASRRHPLHIIVHCQTDFIDHRITKNETRLLIRKEHTQGQLSFIYG